MRPAYNTDNIQLINITEQDYINAAAALRCEVAAIKAVAGVESAGSGFTSDGVVKILFEPHIFWRQLWELNIDPKVALASYPGCTDILYKHWNPDGYGKRGPYQWERLRRAAEINIEAAYKSASFGKFQIMGFNHRAAGYDNIFTMAHYMNLGEKYHLEAFVDLLLSNDWAQFLRRKDWETFARRYNGPGYKGSPRTIKDDYDYKIQALYVKLSSRP